jgi:uncharacterized protein (TIGR02145 family)
VQLPCGPNGDWVTVHTETAGPYTQPEVIILSVTIPDQKLVTGTVVDCDGLPVDAGYALVNGAVHFCLDGVFEVQTCAPSITLRGVDIATVNVSSYATIQLMNDTTDVGDLIACTPLFGTVTDIDGNTYQTVLIGNQEWMAENLRTGTYANGDTIPNVTDNSSWSQLISGAWCNYQNDPDYDTPFGKLYNWFTVVDPRNVCPSDWHVPTDTEWQELELVLGMLPSDVNIPGYRGESQNVGGKLKATTLWDEPNTGATNESAFSSLPGSFRSNSGGFSPSALGNFGDWWSASEDSAVDAWARILYSNNPGVFRYNYSKRSGYSLRCIRD